jgi:hypothetical protein
VEQLEQVAQHHYAQAALVVALATAVKLIEPLVAS